MALTSVFVGATVGFHFLEGWGWFDSFYMSLITITTIGYHEVKPLSDAGRVLNSMVILFGVGTFTYTVTQLMHALVQEELLFFFRTRQMEKSVEKMSDHFIVCGAGRLGARIAHHLQKASTNFVVIEQDEEAAERLFAEGIVVIRADATDEASLERAGVKRARGLVTATGSDPSNVYISLTARDMNPKLFIVARANSIAVEPRLKRAGADRVVTPERIGSRQMADALLRPGVIDFFNDVMEFDDEGVNLEDICILAGSKLDGVTLMDADLPKKVGVSVILVRHPNGRASHQPSGDTKLHADDHLLVVGDNAALRKLRKLAS